MGENNNAFENVSDADKLEWIQTFEKLREPQKGEGMREKMTKKVKENPFVPVGMIATTIALSFGLNAMRQGNKRKSQLMMRARILAQGFTIAAILGGIIIASKTKPADN